MTRKREEISDLLKRLMSEYKSDSHPLPEISFPTLNGKKKYSKFLTLDEKNKSYSSMNM